MTPSARNLLLSNAATLAAALIFHWPAASPSSPFFC